MLLPQFLLIPTTTVFTFLLPKEANTLEGKVLLRQEDK